jgi:hypothetical protein
MNQRKIGLMLVIALLAGAGCNKSKKLAVSGDVKAQVSTLQAAFPAATAQDPTQSSTPAAGFVNADGAFTADAYASMALAALSKGESEKAMIVVQRLQRLPGLTSGQHVALHESMRTMQNDLIRRAAAGDASAKAAVEDLKKNLAKQ